MAIHSWRTMSEIEKQPYVEWRKARRTKKKLRKQWLDAVQQSSQEGREEKWSSICVISSSQDPVKTLKGIYIKTKNWKELLLTDEPFTRDDLITIQNPNSLDDRVLLDFEHVKNDLKVDDEGRGPEMLLYFKFRIFKRSPSTATIFDGGETFDGGTTFDGGEATETGSVLVVVESRWRKKKKRVD
ncbi:peptidyl-prolyl cis-trans isomerase-like 2 [Vigna unguiculata]|uniref:Peptidyl-prolyl cis-trans isomerase-like 2 n=1 Tax=Vigna unguiculata TaxID=3917 RepID=A0A4D6M0B6_VIGUN|nr:peptidyl-prolyl cis-trans isomerase-like 2 [Vigna unguiculata]